MAKIDSFFRLMKKEGASDLHLASGNVPKLRLRGELVSVKFSVLEHNGLMEMLAEVIPEAKLKRFEETGDIDFAYELDAIGRFRANYFRQAHGVSAVFRQIPTNIQSVEDLGLPPICKRFAMMEKGLVLVTGPTGSGKSTTLAAIVDYANRNRQDHIITVEDPLEFKHQGASCLVNHREVGTHTESFAAALRGALREDPDIILVGEMRDLETIQLALEAAATGHLVFGTLHTPNAIKAIDRIIDVFPTNAQEQVRTTLAESLKGVIAQSLCKNIRTRGRVAAMEIMAMTPAAANLIREAKTHQLQNVVQTGRKLGMQTLDDAFEDLLKRGLVDPEEVFEKCIQKERFVHHLHTVPEEYRELLSGGDPRRPTPVAHR